MQTEVEYAVNFLVDTIKEKHHISDESKFRERLTKLLLERYENHWYPEKPMKGSAYRCINISIEESSVDQVLRQAAEESGITLKSLLNIFGKGLALWVDPNDVSCRLGKGAIFFIYKKLKENSAEAKRNPDLHNHTSLPQRRPQQRPRSISPTTTIYNENYLQQPPKPRSTTPPGFSSSNVGNFYQSYPRSTLSAENLQKLWNSIPNTTSYNQTPLLTSYSQAGYASTTFDNYTYSNSYTKPIDSSYSFNQYSSYYNPVSNGWKKNGRYQGKQYQKSNWQDDEIYQRYHWSRNDLKNTMSVAGNSIAMKGYGYSTSRQAQEVC